MDLELLSVKGILIFFRVLSLLWLIPLFSSRSISVIFKGSLSLILTNALIESIDVQLHTSQLDVVPLLVFKEVLIGLSLGFVLRVFFSACSSAGEVLAIQTGLGFARFFDPQNLVQASVLEGFKSILAIMVFFSTDAHHMVIRALGKSIIDIPLGGFSISAENYRFLGEIAGKIFILALKISGPILVVLLIVEIVLGVLSRVVPQVNIFLEGIPIKILISMIVISLWISFGVSYLGSLFSSAEKDIKRVLEII